MNILCPICHQELKKIEKTFICNNRHSFDIARQGYLNLNTAKSNSGDSKEMNIARDKFLNTNAYKFLKDEIIKTISNIKPDSLLDLGCGTGYYTKDFPSNNKIGIDLSKSTLKIASSKDKETLYILTTIFDLPFSNNSIDLITNLFVPLSKKEISRVLKDNGYLVYVRPNINHLLELKEVLYEEIKLNEIEEINIEGLKLIKEYSINNFVNLNNEDLLNLFAMTPYFYKSSNKDKEKLNEINELEINFDFLISIYQKI